MVVRIVSYSTRGASDSAEVISNNNNMATEKDVNLQPRVIVGLYILNCKLQHMCIEILVSCNICVLKF